MSFEFDLLVIGAGSGGVRAARTAARLGAKVAIAEASKFGGTCVHAGCIPKKLLVFASAYARHFADARGFGWDAVTPGFAWSRLLEAKDRETSRLGELYEAGLRTAGVEVLRGRARVLAANAAEVDGRRVDYRYLLVATGSTPDVPVIAGREHAITSDRALALADLPARLVVIGAGYVGLELAGVFHGLGTRVSIVQRSPRILSHFDAELGEHLATELRKQGLELRCGVMPEAIERRSAGLRVALSDGSQLDADQVLFAVGRHPNTSALGLELAGVELTPGGAVHVDGYSRSSAGHVFAVGDCTGRAALTPVAIADGEAAAHTMFGEPRRAADPDRTPSAVFSQPEVASVGLGEEQARERHGEVDTYRSAFTPLRHRLSGRDARSLVKLVVARDTQRVLGCHMVDEEASEIIQGFAAAIQCGATKQDLDRTLALHPTAAEEIVTLR